jgi:hypothetical protein
MQSEIKTPEDLIYDLYSFLFYGNGDLQSIEYLEKDFFGINHVSLCLDYGFKTFYDFIVAEKSKGGLGHPAHFLDSYLKDRDPGLYKTFREPLEQFCM